MMKRGRYDPVHCRTYPVTLASKSAPTEPNIPPSPTTEPIARRGKVSEASVKMLADQPWCAAAANPIRTTAAHKFDTRVTKTTGTTANAHISMAVLRAALTDLPRLIRNDENHPPATLPTVAIW